MTNEHKRKIVETRRKNGSYVISNETKKKMSFSKKEAKSPLWKGDNAGKVAMHIWVARYKGRPKECEMCGTITAKKYEWANIDHSYKRVLDDYIRLCTKCHRCYDRDRGVKVS